ncbi:MAG TPA: GTPase, partial [Burkholderiaceae bacterium]|nr:GTPase [Burkholderiaceae bacterium]
GALAGGATGVAFSFATTYAIGEVARRYYAGGREMSVDLLKRTFGELLSQGRALQAQYWPQIEQQARSLDTARIVQLVRGS